MPGNRAARRQLGRVAPSGALALMVPKDAAWQAARRWAHRAGVHRIRELAGMHGGELSSGVCRLLRSAARLAADAEYLSRRAARDDDPDLLRTAAQLDASARQAERDAWAMADLEARARPPRPEDYPWLVPEPEPEPEPARSGDAEPAEPAGQPAAEQGEPEEPSP
jgi:hypothetical protein